MQKAAQYAARASKRDSREKRIRMFDEEMPEKGLIWITFLLLADLLLRVIVKFLVLFIYEYTAPAKAKSKAKKKKSSFDAELTSTGQRAIKKFRAGYAVMVYK